MLKWVLKTLIVFCILGALMDFMCLANNLLGKGPVTTVLATEWDLLLWKMDKELTWLTTWSDLWNTSGLEDKLTTLPGLSAGLMVLHLPPIGPTLEGKVAWFPVGNFLISNPYFRDRRPQPDNRVGNEFCVAILNNFYGDGIKFHDVACHHTKPALCSC